MSVFNTRLPSPGIAAVRCCGTFHQAASDGPLRGALRCRGRHEISEVCLVHYEWWACDLASHPDPRCLSVEADED